MVALKKVFSVEALKAVGIDMQMQAAFDFFDGKATFGETQSKGEMIFDGNHFFSHTVCTDKVIIENCEEVSVYLEVYTVNIETDTGKIYDMEWASYLKNKKEPNLEGIIYLSIICGDSRSLIGEKPLNYGE